MNKLIYIIITLIIVVVGGIALFGGKSETKNESREYSENTEIIDGTQYISVYAKGGYSPNKTIARSDVPTVLVMKTAGTYDCSVSLVISDVNYRKLLPQTGETEIDLGTQKSGKKMNGMCSMGMYYFSIEFE